MDSTSRHTMKTNLLFDDGRASIAKRFTGHKANDFRYTNRDEVH